MRASAVRDASRLVLACVREAARQRGYRRRRRDLLVDAVRLILGGADGVTFQELHAERALPILVQALCVQLWPGRAPPPAARGAADAAASIARSPQRASPAHTRAAAAAAVAQHDTGMGADAIVGVPRAEVEYGGGMQPPPLPVVEHHGTRRRRRSRGGIDGVGGRGINAVQLGPSGGFGTRGTLSRYAATPDVAEVGLGETVAEGVKLAGAALSEMIEDLGDNLAAQADRLSGTLGLGVGAAGNSHLGRGVEEEAVRVVARLRPQRRPLGRRSARLRAAHGSVQILGEVRAALPATFQLDALLEEHASQEQAYVHTVRPLLPRFLGGARCAVLFCGASGTGKTHSAFGTASVLSNLAAAADSEWGVAPRASRDLFETLGEAVGAGGELQVSVSWLEVRGDQCYDLLDGGKLLRLRESPALGTHAPGLARRPAECHDDVLRHIAHGARRRSTAPTRANMHATRAHTVFTLHLRRRTRRRGRMAPPDACLTLVDLAAGAAGGAHQYVQQQPQPVRARRSAEEAAIHSSLGALSTYLEALRTAQGGGRRRRRARGRAR